MSHLNIGKMRFSPVFSLLFVLAAHALPLRQERQSSPYSAIVMLGDSYSDNGNEFRLSNQSWPQDPAYFDGRFSNGPVWVEDLAANLDVPLRDYAVGGATTSNALVQGYSGKEADLPVPSLAEQAESFLADTKSGTQIDSTLFAILGGANDVLFNPNITAVRTVGVISSIIANLQNRGARHFLLLNYPDFGMIPYDSYVDRSTQDKLRDFSQGLSTELASLTSALTASGPTPTAPASTPDVAVTFVDLVPVFHDLQFYRGGWKGLGYDRFGLYGSCLTGAYVEVPQRTLCTDPDRRVFWDEYHPTGRSHRRIAQTAVESLRGRGRV